MKKMYQLSKDVFLQYVQHNFLIFPAGVSTLYDGRPT